jgi:uncharacterized protein YunC (DUF1805 family)
MIRSQPIQLEGKTAIAIEVQLPRTNLLIITTDRGYIMCGALDISFFNERLKDREVIAARAIGVRSIDELLVAPLESVTDQALELGIKPGMTGHDAILKMI